MGKKIDAKERFDAKYVIDEVTGCWNWTACKVYGIHHSRKWPYGHFVKDGKQIPAHRAGYELYKGIIPDGMCVDHLCRNTLCVNPAHLEVVTHRENIRRGYALKPKTTHCKHGHEMTEENTYIKPETATTKQRRECRICRKAQLTVHYAKR